MVFLKIVSDLFIIKETEKRQDMFDLGSGLSANAVGSKNTEAGVYKSEAFMPDGVNKSGPFIPIV